MIQSINPNALLPPPFPDHTQLPWLRWWDEQGQLLLIGDERAELERSRAEQERQRAENAEQAQRDAIPRLLAMGLTVEQVAEALNLSVEAVREIQQ